MRFRDDSYGNTSRICTSYVTPSCLSRSVSRPSKVLRERYSKPKSSAPATKACSSGEEAARSCLPLTSSTITEWLIASARKNSLYAPARLPCSASKSEGELSASWKLTKVAEHGRTVAHAGRGAVRSAGGGLPGCLLRTCEMAVSPQP